MRFDDSFDVLSILGGWNRHVFTPEWISRYLFSSDFEELSVEVETEVPKSNFDVGYVSPRVSSEEVRVLLDGSNLNFSPVKMEDGIFDRIQEMVIQLADYLPHTPVLGYNVSFSFVEDSVDENLMETMRPSDLVDIQSWGAKSHLEQYTRQLVWHERTCFFVILIEESKATFKFNFYSTLGSLSEFKSSITENSLVVLKNEALKFIREIYSLELERGEK